MSGEKEPIMILDKELGRYVPLNIFVGRVLNHFKGSEVPVNFDLDLERYGAKLSFSIVYKPKKTSLIS